MLNLKSFFRLGGRADRKIDQDVPRTAPISRREPTRRETTARNRKLYAPIELKPLSPEEVRALPAAHRYSA